MNRNIKKSRLSRAVNCVLGLMICALAALGGFAAQADNVQPYQLTIKDHKFSPAEIHVPANQPAQIGVDNQDATAEEFDSSALGVEKVIAGNGRGVVRLHPLAPGRYPFEGEYHDDTAQGVVIAE